LFFWSSSLACIWEAFKRPCSEAAWKAVMRVTFRQASWRMQHGAWYPEAWQ
jgi:hypothetical protein